jgi:hypothetical protein
MGKRKETGKGFWKIEMRKKNNYKNKEHIVLIGGQLRDKFVIAWLYNYLQVYE